ncbi:unnamed protein product [Phyllotreta striolata]|uniref:Uncharacterized protein n=1 Tax=Phyllotreta striolata TaxID=444603 RepID=A0A9N9TXH6_PHYSR|nr:unnamed protein product [Phyllotreta striolata]
MDYHPTGLPGSNRMVLNHFDVSTQANIQHAALTYESEDEMTSKLQQRDRDRRNAARAHYNREDIREQYCITERGLGALETKHSLFGCLSAPHGASSCSNRASLLTACVRQKVPSDENLYDLYKRHPSEYAPYPRRSRYPWGPVTSDIYHYDEDLKTSYFRRKPIIDPSRYTWMPSDDESDKMEKPRSIVENNCHHDRVANPSSSVILPGKKHVSFARSHTLASFDSTLSSLSYSTGHLNRITNSQERLLDVRKPDIQPIITKQPEQEFSEKIKRISMKTQATQTEAGLGRKPLPPHVNLSPRTMQKVKMVSQGAQTNGFLNNRKLKKSFSEAGGKFGANGADSDPYESSDHEPLHRTQSDEPPRSPFLPEPPPNRLRPPDSDASSLTKSDDSTESKQEIFIDFKPQLAPGEEKPSKRTLMKALSDGEILSERRRVRISDDGVVPEAGIHSVSHDDVRRDDEDERIFAPCFRETPILNEGVCKPLERNVYSSVEVDNGAYGQDSIDEDFHEHLIYSKTYLGREYVEEQRINMENWLKDDSIVPSISFLPHAKLSPFTSNDSLANDGRDQSDGIWNESQATVLQADSGTDNGTVLSSSELNSATSPVLALTPSSKRKHMLMIQHQQRSSMDTENLDEELSEQHLQENSRKTGPIRPASRQFLSVENAAPIRKKLTPETAAGSSPLPAVVPDLLLSRTDSCRTNTDVSESTTTDDYITANSGTDSSRKSGSNKGAELYVNLSRLNNGGSSLESTRCSEDMVVPSFAPAFAPNEGDSCSRCNTPVPQIRTGRSTPSDDTSSSCGSYSVGGSAPDLLDRFVVDSVPSRRKKACPRAPASDEEPNSALCSSSGYYESPMEDDTTSWTSPKPDKHRRCKDFTLELSSNNTKSYAMVSNGKSNKRNNKTSPSADKPKRSKPRMRSPMQGPRKGGPSKKHLCEKERKATSEESSCDIGDNPHLSNQNSPRRSKKTKENNKKKPSPRSPINHQKSGANGEKKSSSLPNSLSRKKPSKPSPRNSLVPDCGQSEPKSPVGSPSRLGATKPDKLKALSAESLRSVSPGSDSVFYSDPSTVEHQVHCLHCGKEVDVVTADDPEKGAALAAPGPEEIVRPPAGFEDSPRIRVSGRLFKKLERRIRSEERNYLENRKNRYKTEVRAKSEERGANTYRSKLRSTEKSSEELLKGADSSPSVLPGDPETEDDTGVYDAPYVEGCWIQIDERDEVLSRMSCSSPSDKPSRKDSVSSTESEREFRRKFQAVTHRMVHRKSCLEMYKRQTNKSFARPVQRAVSLPLDYQFKFDLNYGNKIMEDLLGRSDLKLKLEELLKVMLLLWCRNKEALKGSYEFVLSYTELTLPYLYLRFKTALKSSKISPKSCPTLPLLTTQNPSKKLQNLALPYIYLRFKTAPKSSKILPNPTSTYDSKPFQKAPKSCLTLPLLTTQNPSKKLQNLALPYLYLRFKTALKISKISPRSCPTLPLLTIQNRPKKLQNLSKILPIPNPSFPYAIPYFLDLLPYPTLQKHINNIAFSFADCDKTVVVRRESGEFGFRIHGSKPVVVSAIEPGTPAETSGLEVGDIVLSVNGVSVLDKNHSEIVKIAHAGSDTLTMEVGLIYSFVRRQFTDTIGPQVARTCYVLTPQRDEDTSKALFSGYLWKLSGYASGNSDNRRWLRRWFCLKQNGCLYCYKTDADKHPVDVTLLQNREIRRMESDLKANVFVVQKHEGVPLYLAAESLDLEEKWIEEMGKLMGDKRKNSIDGFLERTKGDLSLPACEVKEPDCFGYLVKLGTQWKSWSRRYCILKDACLYFYQEANAKSAFGVAYLHGYRVQQYLSGTKKYAFEIAPADSTKKHYYFHADSDADKKRWIAALEYSIDKWMKI